MLTRLAKALCCLVLLAFAASQYSASASPAAPSGYQGFSYERLPDGSIGPKIPAVKVIFVSEFPPYKSKTFYTDKTGFYRVDLAPGRYYVGAKKVGYDSYSSYPGFFVVTGGGYQTGNFFLTKKTKH